MKYRARIFLKVDTEAVLVFDIPADFQTRSSEDWERYVKSNMEYRPSSNIAFMYLEVDDNEL